MTKTLPTYIAITWTPQAGRYVVLVGDVGEASVSVLERAQSILARHLSLSLDREYALENVGVYARSTAQRLWPTLMREYWAEDEKLREYHAEGGTA